MRRHATRRATELGSFDLVVEAAGDAQLMADSLGAAPPKRRRVPARHRRPRADGDLDGRVIGVDAVLENRVVFGSVNAQRQDWLAGVAALDRARERWQDALEPVVGLRVPLDRFAEAFDYGAGKATLVLS